MSSQQDVRHSWFLSHMILSLRNIWSLSPGGSPPANLGPAACSIKLGAMQVCDQCLDNPPLAGWASVTWTNAKPADRFFPKRKMMISLEGSPEERQGSLETQQDSKSRQRGTECGHSREEGCCFGWWVDRTGLPFILSSCKNRTWTGRNST